MVFQVPQPLLQYLGLVAVLDRELEAFDKPIKLIFIHDVNELESLDGQVQRGGVVGGRQVILHQRS